MWIQRCEEKIAPSRGGEKEREKRALAPLFICFFVPAGPVLCKLGLGRSIVCFT